MFNLLIAVALLSAEDRVAKKFTDVELDPPFDKYLCASVALMESGGPKIAKLPNGRKLLMAVESVVLEDKSPKAMLDAETVCKMKALRDTVAGTQGVQIISVQKSEASSLMVTTEKGQNSELVSKYLDLTETKLQAVARDLPVVGRWKSKDGTRVYLAIGAILDKDGDPVLTDDDPAGK